MINGDNITKIFLTFAILCVSILIGISGAAALDYPHFEGNNIGCDSCHFIYGTESNLLPPWTDHVPANIDDTQYNTLCWSCHNDIEASYVRTHSSIQTDNGYGDWTMDCKTCHDPHYQKQFRTYGGESYLFSGTSTGISLTSLTMAGAGWITNAYQGLVIIPNVSQKGDVYKIVSNTGDTLNIDGPVNLTNAGAGNTFAIVYGKLIKGSIQTINSGSRQVKFFRESGAGSFADGDGAYNGICEACHTQTTYHRNDAGGDHNHQSGAKCTTCHEHVNGFKASCNGCHGEPPVDGGTLVSSPGVTGSATAGGHDLHVNTKGFTCSVCHYNSSGSGVTHNNALTVTMGYYLFSGARQGGSYDGQSGVSYNTTATSPATTVTNTGTKTCSGVYCHSSGQSTSDKDDPVPSYASPVWDDSSSAACGTCHKVTEASGLNSGSHAAHLGTSGVNGCADCHPGAANDASDYSSSNHINGSIDAANSYTAGGPPGNGYGTCSTASCHEDGTGATVVTPEWGTISGACTVCHNSSPSTGSHSAHLDESGIACNDCHDNAVEGTTAPAQHLDGNVDVFDTTSGDLGYPENKTKVSAYSSCSTASCHDDGTGSYVTTPAWGTSSTACDICHNAAPSTGSHTKHLSATRYNTAACGDCHDSAVQSTTKPDQHLDGNVDVYDISSGDLGYPENKTKGSAYSSCSTAYCHSTGQSATDGSSSTPAYASPVWGNAASAACGTCHKVTEASGLTSGSHAEHLGTTGVNGCADCHAGAANDASAYDSTNHVDGQINVSNTYSAAGPPGNGYGICSAASCHSNGLGVYKVTPVWGDSSAGCNACHNALPASGSHTRHVNTSATAYGSVAVNSTSGNYDFGCGNCHPVSTSKHRNGTLDITLNSSHGGTLKSMNNVSDDTSGYVQSAGTSVTCSAAYCHSDKNGAFSITPEWYGGLFSGDVCSSCHGNSPATGSHGSHAVGIHYDGISSGTSGLLPATGASGAGHGDAATSTTISCNICHNNTIVISRNDNNTVCNTCHNAEGNAIGSSDLIRTYHINGTADIAFAGVTVRSRAQIRNDITTVTELNTYWQRNNGYKLGAASHDSSNATLGSTASFSSGTCSTVACHNGNPVVWGSSISCNDCHTALP